MPRFLLRLPYGSATHPIERFDFEEQPLDPAPEAYLWGNPAFGLARLLGDAFLERGWSFEPGDRLELTGLPSHAWEKDGEWRMQPVAEANLTEATAAAILDAGIMPLCSRMGANSAAVLRFQSLSDPPTRLMGPW